MEIMTSLIIYSKTWVQHFTLTTGTKCRWQCNGDTRTHVVHAQLGNYLRPMSTTNLISHTLDILKLISSKGLMVTMFISTILNYKHFLDEKLKLESAILHTRTGDVSPEALALHQFILDSSMLIYSREMQSLMERENGLHMTAVDGRMLQAGLDRSNLSKTLPVLNRG